MQFNSYIFILLFLPVTVLGYFTIGRIHPIARKIWIILSGLVFYIYGGWDIALVFGGSILLNYLCAVLLRRVQKGRKVILVADIVINVGLLFFFKYFNFVAENISALTGASFNLKNLFLPLGISFFTFQQIMYVVKVEKGELTSTGILDYLAYILYFPKLIMGPITEPKDIIDQINDSSKKRVNWQNMESGLKLVAFGLFKKVIIADTMAIAVNWGFSDPSQPQAVEWLLIMLAYTFEIYFDFSGYSDMAVGVSRMMNIDLPMNFDSPYKAFSIRDFWKRWHISLTSFFTHYIYIPLGGSKKGTFRTYLNTMIIFVISGIWHGANWTFLLWGVLHGVFMIFDRLTDAYRKKIHPAIQWGATFVVVNILWLLFRADSIGQWLDILKKIFTFSGTKISKGFLNSFATADSNFFYQLTHLDSIGAISCIGLMVLSFVICMIPENNYRNMKKNNWFTMIIAALALVCGILCLGGESIFVYNNF